MRWYNAAMSRPFQFSIRRMLAATALFGAAMWLQSVAFRRPSHPNPAYFPGEAMVHGWNFLVQYFAFAGAILCGIAGIGAITETKARLIRALGVLAIALLVLGLFVAYNVFR
jgi:lysylphosphatidylglycerol synthetase-like protein (DUF2156 family)